MGAKAFYIDTKNKIIEQLRLSKDIEALMKLKKDYAEYKKFSSGWARINLDEFIDQFKISDDSFNAVWNKRKISFFDDGKQYEIVCAVGASYFRIVRKGYIDSYGAKHGDVYVALDLKEPKINPSLKGIDAKNERNRLTHFKMTYQKGANSDGK